MTKDKMFGPGKVITILRYEQDTEMMEARLLIAKVRNVRTQYRKF